MTLETLETPARRFTGPACDPDPDASGEARRLMRMRWIAIACQIAAIGAAQPLLDIELPRLPMFAIVGLLAAFNLFAHRRLAHPASVTHMELFSHLCVDVSALTVLLFFGGGSANPFVSLYLPAIAIAAALLPARYAWLLAAISAAAYSSLVFYYVPLSVPDVGRAAQLHLAGMWLTFVVSGALITWFISRMTAALRARDRSLAAAREEALRNERIVALGSLAAGAAHELGTPLATMAVIAGELAREPRTPPAMKEDLALLRSQIDLCKGILTGMAGRAGQTRAEGGRRLALDAWLAEVLARWRTLRPGARPRLAIEGRSPAPQVLGEATLEQALVNLLNNAADAGTPDVEIAANWDLSTLRIEVRDRGPGLDEAVLRDAGREPLTSRPGGSGVGLFLASAVVERFGGRLRLFNREGGGAVAHIEVPLARLLAEPA